MASSGPRFLADENFNRRFLTAAGRRFYADHWGAYRRRYPDVAAPEPM